MNLNDQQQPAPLVRYHKKIGVLVAHKRCLTNGQQRCHTQAQV